MRVLNETWRPIPGYEGRYEVSDCGNVRGIWQATLKRRGRLLKPFLSGPKRRQYPRVRLYNGQRRSSDIFVHVLVMLAFAGPPSDGFEIDHLDNDPLNPHYVNLEYVTRSEQHRRSYRRDGRVHPNKGGELSPVAKLTWEQVREIRRRLVSKEISGSALARQMGLSRGAISDIHTGKNWQEVGHECPK